MHSLEVAAPCEVSALQGAAPLVYIHLYAYILSTYAYIYVYILEESCPLWSSHLYSEYNAGYLNLSV